MWTNESKRMRIPKVIREIILDYYWSHRIYEQKQKMHQHIRHLWLLREVHVFYNIFYSPINPNPNAYLEAAQEDL